MNMNNRQLNTKVYVLHTNMNNWDDVIFDVIYFNAE